MNKPPLPPDPINVPQKDFNEPGSLFDSDRIQEHIDYKKQMRQESPVGGSAPRVDRPTVRRDFTNDVKQIQDEFFATHQRGAISSQEGIRTIPLQYRNLIGNFAAVRGARILHQYAIDFWRKPGILESIVPSKAVNPTDSQIVQMYEDFLLFNYLPLAMTPTRAQFSEMVVPSKAVAYVRDHLADMGIRIGTNPAPVSNFIVSVNTNPDNTPVLTAAPPFSERLSLFCKNGVFANG